MNKKQFTLIIILMLMMVSCQNIEFKKTFLAPEATVYVTDKFPTPNLTIDTPNNFQLLKFSLEVQNFTIDIYRPYKEAEPNSVLFLEFTVTFENVSSESLVLRNPEPVEVNSGNTNTNLFFEDISGQEIAMRGHYFSDSTHPYLDNSLEDYLVLPPTAKIIMACKSSIPFSDLENNRNYAPLPPGKYLLYATYANPFSGFKPDITKPYYYDVNAWTGRVESSRVEVTVPDFYNLADHPIGDWTDSSCEYNYVSLNGQ